jgi:hypothetical protein
MRRCLVLALLLLVAATPPAKLPVYEGRAYVIHTDLAGDALREAELRMTKMAEEYRKRTAGFAGQVNQKLPFFLFRSDKDYFAAGGKPGTAGVFNPNDNTLMAVAGDEVSADTWHVVQHEGFHQYARFVIGGSLPVWVNEGMAEYFGEGLFTGDSFVTGVIPPDRLLRVKKRIKSQQYMEFRRMLPLAHADWNAEMSMANYDQAWSMVHFLAHAEGGRYQQPFVSFMRAIGRGQPWERAWLDHFGSADGFEKKWQAWWLAQEPTASTPLYAQATVQTLTSALARGVAQQQQKFGSIDDLLAAIAGGSLKIDDRDWLPPALLKDAAQTAQTMRKRGITIVIAPSSAGPTIACTLKDGTKIVGTFRVSGGRVLEVTSEVAKR